MPLVAQSSLLNEYPVSRRFLGLARALEVFSQGLVSGAVRRIDLECSAQPAKTVFAETILQKDHANFVPQRRIVRVFHHVLDELVHPACSKTARSGLTLGCDNTPLRCLTTADARSHTSCAPAGNTGCQQPTPSR